MKKRKLLLSVFIVMLSACNPQDKPALTQPKINVVKLDKHSVKIDWNMESSDADKVIVIQSQVFPKESANSVEREVDRKQTFLVIKDLPEGVYKFSIKTTKGNEINLSQKKAVSIAIAPPPRKLSAAEREEQEWNDISRKEGDRIEKERKAREKYGSNKKCARIGVGFIPLRFCKDDDDQIRLKNPFTNN